MDILKNQIQQILDQSLFDCEIDSTGEKIQMCRKCIQNVGSGAEGKVICASKYESE